MRMREEVELVQVGMRAGTLKGDFSGYVVNFIDEYPIALNMAAAGAFPSSVKRMIFVLMEIKHGVTADGRLTVSLLTQKVLPNFFKFFRFMPFYRNFPAQNSLAFLNGGGSLSVKKFFPRHRVAVRGADRALALIVKPVFIGSGIRRGSFRNSIGRYFHKVNIA